VTLDKALRRGQKKTQKINKNKSKKEKKGKREEANMEPFDGLVLFSTHFREFRIKFC
jgi:hypothetical protein